MAYTPGPWRTYRDKNKRVSQIMSDYGRICTIHPSDANGEDNARLIAAAPELLEAAEEASQMMHALAVNLERIPGTRVRSNPSYQRVRDKVDRAVAKVKGEVE